MNKNIKDQTAHHRQKMIFHSDIVKKQFIENCRKIQSGYPQGHNQIDKINKQLEMIEHEKTK